jgi:hypothetical protein
MLSLIFVVIGIWLIYRARKNKSQIKTNPVNWVRTMGKVVDFETRWGAKFRSFAPEVAFKTNQNQLIRFVSTRFSNSFHYEVGQVVEVYYDSQNPSSAGIVGYTNPHTASSNSFIGGILLILLGSFFLIVPYRFNSP